MQAAPPNWFIYSPRHSNCSGASHKSTKKQSAYLFLSRPGFRARPALWLEPKFPTIERMTIQRIEHVGIVVDDLAATTEFFVELGLELQGEWPVEGRWVDCVVGLDGVRAEIAFLPRP